MNNINNDEMSQKIADFLSEYSRALDKTQKAKLDKLHYDIWSFSDEKEMSDKLIHLVLSSKKTATTGLFFESEKIPTVGSLGIILDHDEDPRCLIEYVEVSTRIFTDVDIEFARDEGEGFASLEDWRNEHRKVFKEWHKDIFSDESLVVCERFNLLFPRNQITFSK